MIYYLFTKASDIENVQQELDRLDGIEWMVAHNRNGILPENYIQVSTVFYSDLGLATIIQSTLKNKYRYVLLKSLHTSEVLV